MYIDPRKYQMFRHLEILDPAEQDAQQNEVDKMRKSCSQWMLTRITALLAKLAPPQIIVDAECLEEMHELSSCFKKYECLRTSKRDEYNQEPWRTAKVFFESQMQREGFKLLFSRELIAQVKWMVKMFDFNWVDEHSKVSSSVIHLAVNQIQWELNKDPSDENLWAHVNVSVLDDCTFVLERGLLRKVSGDNTFVLEPGLLREVSENNDNDNHYEGLFKMLDYVKGDRRVREDKKMISATKLVILKCCSTYVQHGDVAKMKRVFEFTEWIYSTASDLLVNKINEENCQLIVDTVEALLMNAWKFETRSDKMCLLLFNYMKFEYLGGLKEIDIKKKVTFAEIRHLIEKNDWYTEDDLRQVIGVAEKMMESTPWDQSTKEIAKQLKKKLEKVNKAAAQQ